MVRTDQDAGGQAISASGADARDTLSPRRDPGAGYDPEQCGQFDIRIAADGAWWHEGRPIRRIELVKLFARVLRREGDDYLLVTPVERGLITVEDAPFVAVEMAVVSDGPTRAFRFRTNLDEWVTLDADHPIRLGPPLAAGGPRPYITVRPGLDARIARAVFYELVEHGQIVADADGVAGERFGIWSGGRFHPLE